MSSLIRFTRPTLATALDQLRAELPPEDLAELDSKVSSAAERIHGALRHVEVWPLAGEEGLWVKLPTLAEVKGVTARALQLQIDAMLASGEATEADIRRDVRNNAVDSIAKSDFAMNESASKLTNANRGVTMLSWRLARLCAMKSEGEVGIEVRRAMLAVEDEHAGLEQVLHATALVQARRARALLAERRAAEIAIAPSETARRLGEFVTAMGATDRAQERSALSAALLRNDMVLEAIATALADNDPTTLAEFRALPTSMPSRYSAPIVKHITGLRDWIVRKRRVEEMAEAARQREELRIAARAEFDALWKELRTEVWEQIRDMQEISFTGSRELVSVRSERVGRLVDAAGRAGMLSDFERLVHLHDEQWRQRWFFFRVMESLNFRKVTVHGDYAWWNNNPVHQLTGARGDS